MEDHIKVTHHASEKWFWSFGFQTLRIGNIFPWSVVFCIFFFCCFFLIFDYLYDSSIFIGFDLYPFVRSQRFDPDSKKVTILIAGSSMNGMGVDLDLLRERFAVPVDSICVGNGNPWLVRRLLDKYRKETDQTEILIVDIHSWFYSDKFILFPLEKNSPKAMKLRYYYYRKWSDWRGINSQQSLRLIDMLQTIRFSLKDLSKNTGLRGGRSFQDVRRDYAKKRTTVRSETCYSRYDKFFGELAALEPVFNNYLAKETIALAKDCEKRGIRLVFNTTPLPDRGERFGPPELLSQYHFLRDQLASFDHVTVLPLIENKSEWLGAESEDGDLFRDHCHMLPLGTTHYTEWLIDRIAPLMARHIEQYKTVF